jgi:ATP-dependent helicase/DNAse subunit B
VKKLKIPDSIKMDVKLSQDLGSILHSIFDKTWNLSEYSKMLTDFLSQCRKGTNEIQSEMSEKINGWKSSNVS